MTTGADGTYSFTDLEAGEYKVVFSGSKSIDLGDYGMTVQNASGGNDADDSDAAAILVENDKGLQELHYGYIELDYMPTAENMNVFVLSDINEDMGLTLAPLNVEKVSTNDETHVLANAVFVLKDSDGNYVTRDEYHRILAAACDGGMEKDYLLIKAFASVGIGVRDLPYFTVANCVNGTFPLPGGRKAVVPESLQKEVLEYCLKHELYSGPIFVTKYGNIIDHSNIIKMMRVTAKNAGVEPGKCTLKKLHGLYCTVKEDVEKKMELLYMQEFDRLM